jgi:hypothetical protein
MPTLGGRYCRTDPKYRGVPPRLAARRRARDQRKSRRRIERIGITAALSTA